jgi:site-specific DNA-methyltransferase (cytosine-N4-specific)
MTAGGVVTGAAYVLRGDAGALPLPDASVDLVVTSPPYWALRSYTDDGGRHYTGQIGDEPTPGEYVASLVAVTREAVRVLKPTGSLWVNLGDKYNAYNGNRGEGTLQTNTIRQPASAGAGLDVKDVRPKSLLGIPWRYALRCIDDLGLILRAEVIWSKPNGLPESVTDRVRRSHETWFHFTLTQRYYADLDPIREPCVGSASLSANSFYRTNGRADLVPGHAMTHQHRTDRPNTAVGNRDLGRIPGSVWHINTEPLRVPDELGVDHFAAFPSAFPKRIISGWCPEDGTVLDPFGGTGTTAMVAKALGRVGVSVDRSGDYCRIARWRTNDRDQLAKVLRLPKVPQEPAEQGSLLDLLHEGEM